MNYKRLLPIFLSLFFISMPQIVMSAAALGDIEGDMNKAVDDAVRTAGVTDAGQLSAQDMDALASKLAEISKGDTTALERLFEKNNTIEKNDNIVRFTKKFNQQAEDIQSAIANESAVKSELKSSDGVSSPARNERTSNALDIKKYKTERNELNKKYDKVDTFKKEASKDFAEKAKEIKKFKDTKEVQEFGKKIKLTRFNTIEQEQGFLDAYKKLERATNLPAARSALIEMRRIQEDINIDQLPENLQQTARAVNDAEYKKLDEFFKNTKDLDAKVKVSEESGSVIPKSGAETGGSVVEVTVFEKFLSDTIKEETQAFRQESEKYLDEETTKFENEIASKYEGDVSYWNQLSYRPGKTDVDFLRARLKDMRENNLAFDAKVEEEFGGQGGRLSRLRRGIWNKLKMSVETLISALIFMVPNIFQSAYLAQQQKASELATWARPIEYGGRVWQVPDWCINLENPSASIPLYVQIPVNKTDASVSATLATMFPGLAQGEPTSNNPVSSAIHNVSSDFWSAGSVLETKIKRYAFSDELLKHTDIAVMYGSPTSMAPTATARIGGAEFTGQLVSLKTGLVIYPSGETDDATGIVQAPGIPLITGNPEYSIWGTLNVGSTPASQGLKPLTHAYETLMEKMEEAGINVTFTQYQNVGSGSSGKRIGVTHRGYFDTTGIDDSTGAVTSDCRCLLKEGLADIANGLELDASGNVATGTVDVSSAGWQGLGSVTPIFGWGKDKKSIIIGDVALDQNSGKSLVAGGVFKGFNPSTVGFSGIEKIQSTGTDKETTNVQDYADPNTVWSAQGCWIYLCSNTPFIKALQGNTPSSAFSNMGSLTDYIVFMDRNLSIVPLMVPNTVDKTYTEKASAVSTKDQAKKSASTTTEQETSGQKVYQTSELTLNPAIEFWTSLVFYNQPFFTRTTTQGAQGPVMYDLKGGLAIDNQLGTLAGTAKPSGAIPNYLNASQGVSIAGTYPDIFNQLELHKAALLYKLQELDMTIGNAVFKQTDYVLNIQGQAVSTYSSQDFHCFATNTPDLLVALSNNGNPINLPQNNLMYMQSLITDITYQLDTKTNTWVPATSYPNVVMNGIVSGFKLSPLKLDNNNKPVRKSDGSYEVVQGMDAYLQNLGNWLQIQNPTLDGTLDTSGNNGNPLTTNTTAKNDPTDAKTITANQKLIAYVQKQRLVWLAGLDSVVELGKGANTILANIANSLTIGYAKSNGCYVYEMSPSPSILYTTSGDYFVAVDSAVPTLTNITKTVNLKKVGKNAKVTLVSLLTGTLYTMTGQPIVDQSGNPKTISIPSSLYASGKTTSEIIYGAFTSKFMNLPTLFMQSYKTLSDAYAKSQMLPMGPYSFGKYKVSIRSADYALGQNSINNNYVYFDAAQMTKSEIVPTDMYVILDAGTLNTDVYTANKKQLLVSLITGIAVDQQGVISNTLLPETLATIIGKLEGGWSEWVKENITRLQGAYKQHQQQMEDDQAELEKAIQDFAQKHDKASDKDQAKIVQIIKNLQPVGGGLPAPYASLEYDKNTGNYVHPTPLNNQGDLLYLFMSTGKVYRQDGSYVSSYQPAHIKAVRNEYGVVLMDSKSGTQKLGVPMMQPSLIMDKEDLEIKPGQSGASMIASNTADFPGEVVNLAKGYYLYFSKIMNTYYILDAKNDRWMSVDGGHVYQKDGQPLFVKNPVAMSSDEVPLLLYSNKDGFMQAYMADGADYANLSESNESMTWLGLPPSFKQYSVTTNAKSAEAIPTKYTVQDSSKNTTTYTLSKTHTWQMLMLVPITSAGVLMKNIPNSSYQYVQLVQNTKEELTHVIYNQAAYKVTASVSDTAKVGTVYTCEPIEETVNSVPSITITIGLVDPNTDAPYILVAEGTQKYKYAYIPKSYTQEEQETNRANIIHGVTASSPLPIQVGPMHEVSQKVGQRMVERVVPDYITHVLFEADLPTSAGVVQVKPVAANSVYNAPNENPEEEEFLVKFTSGAQGFGGVFETPDNRFVYKIAGSLAQAQPSTITFDYISENAYVDLKTAAVYDVKTGQALGQCLNMSDFSKVLDACSVTVSNKTIEVKGAKGQVKTINKAGKNMLVYRNAQIIEKEAETIESESEENGKTKK